MLKRIFPIIKIALLSIVVILICCFFMSKKINLDIDECFTYGLANNSFQMNVESYKEYTGEEILLNYAAARDGHLFDVKNVFFNQKMDTHPPFYFLLVNFVCSIFKNTFSMWYGLSINILFMVILYWAMRALLYKVIKNNILATTLPFFAFTLYGFINNYAFTRMYVMLSAISMLFILLVMNYIKKTSKREANEKCVDLKFLVLFYINCVFGILTQYHFVLIAAFFSIVLAIHLLIQKRYIQLILVFVSGVISIITSIIIFPALIGHIFGGANSMHSVPGLAGSSTFVGNFPKLFTGLYSAFLGLGVIPYAMLLVIGLIIYIIKNNRIIKSFDTILKNNYLYFLILLCVIYYFIVICFTVKLSFQRYLYNIYPLIFIVIISPLCIIYQRINKYLFFVPLVLAAILGITTTHNHKPTSLNESTAPFIEYLNNNRDTKMILLYRTTDDSLVRNSEKTSLWQLPTSMYLFKGMKNMTLVDISNDEALTNFSNPTIEGHNDILLVIYTHEDDQKYIRYIMDKNNVSEASRVYFTTYFHVYRLS